MKRGVDLSKTSIPYAIITIDHVSVPILMLLEVYEDYRPQLILRCSPKVPEGSAKEQKSLKIIT